MVKKRIIGVITVLDGLAVQSFGYRSYLPLGRPEILIENLDRWGIDEILIKCIGSSKSENGPNLNLLKRIGDMGLSTPLIYAGGIRNADDATKVISLGADRILLDAVIWDDPCQLEYIARVIGSQAIIASLPVCLKENNLWWRDYRTGVQQPINNQIISRSNINWASEIMLVDWLHEGIAGGFDAGIAKKFPARDKNIILFGGISEPSQIQYLLSIPNIAAIGIGNFLSYKEHAFQLIRCQMQDASFRETQYAS